MNRAALKMGTAAGILAGALAWLGPVAAQPTKLPESMTKPSHLIPIITKQLRMAKRFGETALESFQAMPPDDLIVTPKSLDERTVEATRDTYIMIRAAKEGLDYRRYRQKSQDPELELTYTKVFEAWNLTYRARKALRACVDRNITSRRDTKALSLSTRRFPHAMP
jgi:hypothetical protein